MDKELWYLLIGAEQDAVTGVYGNFYVYAEHLGEALNKVFMICREHHFYHPYLAEAEYVDGFDSVESKDEWISISDDIFMHKNQHTYPLSDPDKEFISPTGIVKSTVDCESDYSLIKESFLAYDANEDGIYHFELVIGKDKLIGVFINTIGFLPSVDGFWIYVRGHWENTETELWVAKHFTDKKAVVDFLCSQQKNTLENGYIEIVVHSLEGETNLKLSDHKTISLDTKSQDVFDQFIRQIVDLGYEQTTDFYSLAEGYHHRHYRPDGSLSREEFIAMLQHYDFELLDKWQESEDS